MTSQPPPSEFAGVASAIINVIPPKEEYKGLIDGIRSILKSSKYKAPEAMMDCWINLGQVLTNSIPTDQVSENWVVQISKMIRGEIDYKQFLSQPIN